MLWDKARYFQNALQVKKALSVTHMTLPKTQTLQMHSAEVVKVHAVPLRVLETKVDHVTEVLSEYTPQVIVLQLDPMLYMSKYRWVQHIASKAVSKHDALFQLRDFTPHSLEECTVNLQILDMLSQGKGFKQNRSFGLYHEKGIPAKDMENMTGEFIKAINEHVFDGQTIWPYMELAVFPAVMSKIPVVLADLPELQSRMILGNSLSLRELREIFAQVLSVLKKHYERQTSLLTPQMTLHMLFSHIFNPVKDRYFAALLRRVVMTYQSVDVWMGATHLAPLISWWSDVPDLTQTAAIPDRRPEDSDDNLIEKQVILDVLHSSSVWSHPLLTNPFPYLSANPSPDQLMTYKQTFHRYLTDYQSYFGRLSLPEALVSKLKSASS